MRDLSNRRSWFFGDCENQYDNPDTIGAVVARILRGTRVVVTGRKDDWYRVKYDAKGSEGWVFKTAIGM